MSQKIIKLLQRSEQEIMASKGTQQEQVQGKKDITILKFGDRILYFVELACNFEIYMKIKFKY